MNQRLMTILLCAFVAAAGASYVVYRLVGNEVNSRARGRAVAVVVAAHDVEIGAILKKEDLKTGTMIGDLPKGIELKPTAVIGRGVVSKLYEGEPIVEDRLAAAGSGGGLAATIPHGMRACAVKVNEVVGLAGFVVPGMRVDVLISGSSSNALNSSGAKVKTLLQNIQVLSAGTNFQRDAEGKPVQVQVVNLLVNPAEAEMLSLASNETKIQLVLRNPLDTQMSKPPGSEMTALFGDAPPPRPVVRQIARTRVEKPAPVQPQAYTVLVMNGSKESQQTFPAAGAAQ